MARKPNLNEAEASLAENLVWTRNSLCAVFPTGKAYTDAIRRKCLDCCCGDKSVVAGCEITTCALWPFRFGSSPFKGAETGTGGGSGTTDTSEEAA